MAWCFPPYIRKVIVDCINSFKRRRMRGYICVPYEKRPDNNWISETQRICKQYIAMKGRNTRKDIFISDPSIFKQRCAFDIFVFFFDYQQ